MWTDFHLLGVSKEGIEWSICPYCLYKGVVELG